MKTMNSRLSRRLVFSNVPMQSRRCFQLRRCRARPAGHLTIIFDRTAGHLTKFPKSQMPGGLPGGEGGMGEAGGGEGMPIVGIDSYMKLA